jgi:FAD/FMN-containing dehydrogenase
VAAFGDEYKARDVIDEIDHLGNVNVIFYSSGAVRQAQKLGKKYPIVDSVESDDVTVIMATVNDLSPRTQSRKVKRIIKACEQFEGITMSGKDARDSEFANIESIGAMSEQPFTEHDTRMPVLEGMYVSLDRFDEFMAGVGEMEKANNIELALIGRPIEGTWTVRPELSLKSASGKQLLLKLIDNFAILVAKCGGTVAGQNGEGRLQAFSGRRTLDSELIALFDAIRAIFDPQNTLNPGAKQAVDIHDVAKQLRSEFSWQ